MDIDRPHTLDEAVEAAAADPDATLLAGGTDLMVGVNLSGHRPGHVIALRRIEELAEWTPTRIGAGVTFARLEHSEHAALAQAARTVGSPQIRNAATIGGNLGTASPAGDALPFLAAVDASIEIASARGRRTVPFTEFVVGPKRTILGSDEIVAAVVLPERAPGRQAFAKVGPRNAMVISIASACLVRDEDGTTRIALGSVGPTVIRARAAEEMISAEARPGETAVAEFARLVQEEVRPITDHRSTEAYRRHASGVLARRLLQRCLV